MGHNPMNGRLLPAFLILACLIPTAFGVIKASEIIAGGHFALEFSPAYADRLPLLLHVFGGVGFLLTGAVQILPGIRRRNPARHRALGKAAIPLGLLGALSGLWMTLAHPAISGDLLYWGRIFASLVWAGAILMGIRAILRRDFRTHGAWMVRAYAIALPAGTLALVLLPMVLILGEEGHDLLFEIIQVAAWPAHVAIAEWLMRRRRPRPLALPMPAE